MRFSGTHMATATVDRLMHHAHVCQTSGDSIRLAQALAGKGVGAENLCHQAILMNHASGMVAPLDPELIEVGDAIGQWAQRRGLVQGSVRPVPVVATRGRSAP